VLEASIDRVDPLQGYLPENCRIVTLYENHRKSWSDVAVHRRARETAQGQVDLTELTGDPF
jgi:hypothetical protein